MNEKYKSYRSGNPNYERGYRKNNGNYNKNYDSAKNVKRNPSGNKKSYDPLQQFLTEILPIFKNVLEANITLQKKIADSLELKATAEEKRAGAMERIADALANIADQKVKADVMIQNMSSLLLENKKLSEAETKQEGADIPHSTITDVGNDTVSTTALEDSVSIADPSNREEILQLITQLHNEGKYYNQIAEFLETRGVPTFSGEDKWHASTVSSLLEMDV